MLSPIGPRGSRRPRPARAPPASVQFLLSLASTVNAVPLPSLSEVFGVRLPPPAHRLTAPNFTLAPRTAGVPAPGQAGEAGAGGEAGAPDEADDSDGDGDGLFGDDDDDDEDEEMEDATADYPAGPNGLNGGATGEGGVKRGREEDSEEEEFEEV